MPPDSSIIREAGRIAPPAAREPNGVGEEFPVCHCHSSAIRLSVRSDSHLRPSQSASHASSECLIQSVRVKREGKKKSLKKITTNENKKKNTPIDQRDGWEWEGVWRRGAIGRRMMEDG